VSEGESEADLKKVVKNLYHFVARVVAQVAILSSTAIVNCPVNDMVLEE
jgi:hypothetical protein